MRYGLPKTTTDEDVLKRLALDRNINTRNLNMNDHIPEALLNLILRNGMTLTVIPSYRSVYSLPSPGELTRKDSGQNWNVLMNSGLRSPGGQLIRECREGSELRATVKECLEALLPELIQRDLAGKFISDGTLLINQAVREFDGLWPLPQ